MIVRVVASLLCPRLSSEPPGNAPILSISSIGREMPHIWYYCQKLRWNLCCYYNALALSTTSSKWHVFTELISLLCLFGFSTWKTSLLCKEEDETLENITFMQRRRWNNGKHYFYKKKKMKPWKKILLWKEEDETLEYITIVQRRRSNPGSFSWICQWERITALQRKLLLTDDKISLSQASILFWR